ncbi:MAG: hypothetical protein ACXVIJ_06460 [Thermoanaerobaculia bacterium]
MRGSTICTVILGSALAVEAAAACNALPQLSGEIAANPAALRIFWGLLERSRYGFSHMEAAAFIIRGANGAVSSIPWPEADEPDMGRWTGAFPANTVAIVHTHPNWLPLPSYIDAHTATHTRTQVYVVTRSRITKTDGSSTTTLVSGDWKPTDTCGAIHTAG